VRFVVLGLCLAAVTGCAKSSCGNCPTATLTANGKTELVVGAGDMITYVWSSTNADQGASMLMIAPTSPDPCGNKDGSFSINAPEGMIGPAMAYACQMGFVYTITFVATSSTTGMSASADIVITVN
jgi:hypothetical protein